MISNSPRASFGSPRLVDRTPADRMESSAHKMVMRKLELRDHTRAELLCYLTSRGVSAQVADHVLDRCQEAGLIDDVRFAHAWVDCRRLSGKRSARAVRAELRNRGVAGEIIETALLTYSPSLELDAARAFVARRYRAAGGRDRIRIFRSISGALGRRGYPSSICLQVAKETTDRLLLVDPSDACD